MNSFVPFRISNLNRLICLFYFIIISYVFYISFYVQFNFSLYSLRETNNNEYMTLLYRQFKDIYVIIKSIFMFIMFMALRICGNYFVKFILFVISDQFLSD